MQSIETDENENLKKPDREDSNYTLLIEEANRQNPKAIRFRTRGEAEDYIKEHLLTTWKGKNLEISLLKTIYSYTPFIEHVKFHWTQDEERNYDYENWY